jgi:hypothetical protein
LKGLKKIEKTENKIKVYHINNGAEINRRRESYKNGIKTKNRE